MIAVISAFAGKSAIDSAKYTLTPPTMARLGYSALPPVVLADADLHAVRDATRAIIAQDTVSARSVLDRLSGKYPDDPEVRFLIAAIHASEGAFTKAALEVGRLLELDFYAFAGRFENDAAFAKLRASAEGMRLREHLRAIEVLWRQAALIGLPSMISSGYRGEMEIWRSRYLRGCIYLHDVGRFLPLEPGVNGAASVLINTPAAIVAIVTMDISACHDHNCPRITSAGLSVFHLDDWRRSPDRWRYEDEASKATMLELRVGFQGAAVRVYDCCCWNGCVSPWTVIGSKKPAKAVATAADERLMSVDVRGSLLDVRPSGHQLRNGRLYLSGAMFHIQLDAEHGDTTAIHDILFDHRDGMRLVMSTVDRCECLPEREGPILRHIISTVDPARKKATVILRGEGAGAAMLDGKQALYIQTGTTVLRWSSIASLSTEPGTPIMPGVVLVVPRSLRGDCCGL